MKTKKFIRTNPHLPVINLRQTLDYYRDTLGFYDEWTEGDTDGGIRRDEMWMLFGEAPHHVERVNGAPARLNLMWFVDNIDEVYAEFKERGVELTSDLQTFS